MKKISEIVSKMIMSRKHIRGMEDFINDSREGEMGSGLCADCVGNLSEPEHVACFSWSWDHFSWMSWVNGAEKFLNSSF